MLAMFLANRRFVLPQSNQFLKFVRIRNFKYIPCVYKPRVQDEQYPSKLPSDYWDYSEQYGPSNWEKSWKTNKRQSPIEILTKLARYDPTLGPMNIDRTPFTLNLQNIGVTISVTSNDNKNVLIDGGAMKHQYQFGQFHFHWGENNTCGCEHVVDGQRFAAELHIVHWNKDLYPTVSEARISPDGLAVLGVFLDACEMHDPNIHLNELLKMFDDALYKYQHCNFSTLFTPYDLLPENKEEYFTYLGSLTTPPLTENVTWTVLRQPLKISLCQLAEFNKLISVPISKKDLKYKRDFFCRANDVIPQPPTITRNCRPTQPLFDRVVKASFKLN